MGRYTVIALRVVIALSLAGSIVVQAMILPAVWRDLEGAEQAGRIALVTIAALGVLTLQVCAVCIWQLLTMVRKGAVFSSGAFRYVNVIAASIGFSSLLLFTLAALLAPGGTAPGIVALIGGFGLVAAGLVLLVLVMRSLLAQAVELRSEMDEVV